MMDETKCKAVQMSDQMVCECGNVWDANDIDPPKCKEIPPKSMQLKLTGKKIKFTDVNIGQPFYSDGLFWTRSSHGGGCSLGGSLSRGPLGSCSFIGEDIDGEDQIEEVEEVICES